MTRIEKVWWQPFRLPLQRPLATAHGAIAQREGIVIGLEWEGGLALGEASPLPAFGGGGLDECLAALRQVAPLLAGADGAKCWEAGLPLPGKLSPGARGALSCGLETALASILSAEAGLPAWQWLANAEGLPVGTEPGVIPVNALVDASAAGDAATEARVAVAAGYRTLKVKVGRDAVADLERIEAVHAAAGPGVALRVDANGAWSVAEAIERLRAYERLGVVLAEQPVPATGTGAIAALAAVRGATGIRVAADEACTGPAEALLLIDARAIDALVVKPMIIGLRAGARVIRVASTAAVPVIVTTAFDSSIGTMAAVHLAAMLPAPREACGLATLGVLAADIARGVPVVEDGRMAVPAAQGAGILLDEATLRGLAIGPREWAATR